MTRPPLTRLLLPLGLGGALALGILGLSRCFSPTLPTCSYICNSDEPRCPDEYECRADGYCHLKGSTEACPYTMDLSPAPPRPDLAGSADLASSADLAGSADLGATDL